jgi:hypothetical protein
MMSLPLQQVPNQSFSALLDGNQWDFVLKTVEDTTTVSLTLNGNDIMDNGRAVAGGFIIPSIYQEYSSGNFFFVTQNFDLPYYTEFTVTQYLIYVSAAELAALRAPSASPFITADDFNPIAALPLRFSPQGYVLA